MFSKSIVKYIQSLQHKKFRDIHNAFVAEGPKVVEEFLEAGEFLCVNIYATEEWEGKERYRDRHLTIVKDHELEKLAAYATPNKVVAEFAIREFIVPESFTGITLMLDDIRDPGNLGTIIRTADWFGVETILCSPGTVDMYNPKVVQSTMASLGRVNVVYCDLEPVVEANADKTYAAVLDGDVISSSIKEDCFLIIGNESHGVRRELSEKAAHRISIPRYGAAESLNAAVATAILLYALKS